MGQRSVAPAVVVGLITVAVLYGALALPVRVSDALIKEDGVIETIGAMALFVTAAVFAVLARRGRAERRPALAVIVLAGLAVVFFVGGGEEISWGQRVFDIATPDSLSEINRQQETNLHNIGVVSTLAEATFVLLWVGMALVAPVAARTRRVGGLVRRYVPVIALPIGLVFVLNFAVAKVLLATVDDRVSASKYPAVHRVTETKESVYSVLFAVGAMWLASSRRRTDRIAR